MSAFTQLTKTGVYYFFKHSKTVAALLALIILVAGWFVLLLPKYQTIRNQGLLDFGNKREELERRQNYLERLQQMVDQYSEINQASVKKLKEILPDTEEIPQLFVMLDKLAADMSEELNTGVAVTRIALTPQAPATLKSADSGGKETSGKQSVVSTLMNPLGSGQPVYAGTPLKTYQLGSINIVVQITIEDMSYTNFKKILNMVEQNARLFDINTLSYQPGDSEMLLNMTTYYLSGS